MSFGYSVGDVLLLAEKLHDLCIALNDSRRNAPRQIQLLAAEFGRYGDRLQDLHQTLLRYGQAPNSGSVSFEDTLKECDEFLAKYSPLSDSGSNKIKWLYRVATWTTEEKTIQRLRDQVAGHVHDIGMDSNNLMIASVLEILKILKGPSSLAPQERSLATISEEAYEPPTPSLAAIENTKRSNLLLDQMPQTGGLNRQGPREIAGPRARNLLQAAPSQDDNILTPMALPSALGISGLSPQYDLSGRTFERAKYNLKRRTNIAIQRNETPPASGGPASSPTFLAQASRVHTLPDDYESDQSVQIQSDVEKLMKRLSCASATSRASLEQEELSRISEEANKLLERSQYSKKRSSIASIRIQDVDFSLPVSTRSRINLKRRARIICPQISMKELVCDLELSKTPEGVTESIYMIVNNGSHLIQHVLKASSSVPHTEHPVASSQKPTYRVAFIEEQILISEGNSRRMLSRDLVYSFMSPGDYQLFQEEIYGKKLLFSARVHQILSKNHTECELETLRLWQGSDGITLLFHANSRNTQRWAEYRLSAADLTDKPESSSRPIKVKVLPENSPRDSSSGRRLSFSSISSFSSLESSQTKGSLSSSKTDSPKAMGLEIYLLKDSFAADRDRFFEVMNTRLLSVSR